MNFEYHCVECGRRYAPEKELFYTCPVCAMSQQPAEPIRGALRIMLSYSELAESMDRFDFWPQDWLPVEPDLLPDYPVGATPLIAPERLRQHVHFPNLYFKDDSRNPTGCLKDRASLLVAGMARKMGNDHVIVAAAGNAASSMAGVAAAAGMTCVVLVPDSMPAEKLLHTISYGATIIPVRETYDAVFDLSIKISQKYGWLNGNIAYNPFTVEGIKTVAIEMYQQLDDQAPDAIFIPTADGTILSGIYKGFYDLFQLDLIEVMPQLIPVQPENSCALVRALTTNSLEPLDHADTIADSLNVRIARNGIMAIKDTHKSCGFGVTVTDEDIIAAQLLLANQTGLLVEPAAACALAGFLSAKSELDPGAKVVLLLTGTGLKNSRIMSDRLQMPEPVEADVDAIVKRIELESE